MPSVDQITGYKSFKKAKLDSTANTESKLIVSRNIWKFKDPAFCLTMFSLPL